MDSGDVITNGNSFQPFTQNLQKYQAVLAARYGYQNVIPISNHFLMVNGLSREPLYLLGSKAQSFLPLPSSLRELEENNIPISCRTFVRLQGVMTGA
jgi:hypothetical protein